MVSDEEMEAVGERGESWEPPQERGEVGWVGRCWGDMSGVRGSSAGGGEGVRCFSWVGFSRLGDFDALV